jgi:uncharacterized membrane protein YbaN (DUF454 family)
LKTFALRVGRIILGIVCILMSILGFIFPFLPAFPFLVAGVMFLCPESRFAIWLKGKWEKMKTTVRQKGVLKVDIGSEQVK